MSAAQPSQSKITPEIVAEHGFKRDEYKRLLEILGREPLICELGIFSVMWSEHCSYKSSRVWLKTLPTSGPQVIQGPGENAGVVDLGDGDAVVFKMESHNHPSYIEPFQGAATGVGGIMRDVFTMGARPVANMNALRFGAPDHPKTRHLVDGVVAGIAHYGNCTGVPTIGGETNFDAGYNNNILVNAMCVGLAQTGQDLLLGRQGRRPAGRLRRLENGPRRHPRRDDGVGGVRRQERREAPDRAGRRPLHRKAADRSVPRTDGDGLHHRHPGHGRGGPHVVDLRNGGQGRRRHRTQSRPRAAARSGHDRLRDDALGISGAHADDAEAGPRGRSGSDHSRSGASTSRSSASPPTPAAWSSSTRAWSKPICRSTSSPTPRRCTSARGSSRRSRSEILPEWVPAPNAILGTLKTMMGSPALASRRWIWEQYDHMVMGDTVGRPGGDAGVVRVHGTKKGIAVACDVHAALRARRSARWAPSRPSSRPGAT